MLTPRTPHLIPAILLGVAYTLPAQAAPITWDLNAASCKAIEDTGQSCDPAAQYPIIVGRLTLTEPGGIGLLTGDPFMFNLLASGDGPNTLFALKEPLKELLPPLGVEPWRDISDGEASVRFYWTEVFFASRICFALETIIN